MSSRFFFGAKAVGSAEFGGRVFHSFREPSLSTLSEMCKGACSEDNKSRFLFKYASCKSEFKLLRMDYSFWSRSRNCRAKKSNGCSVYFGKVLCEYLWDIM